MPVKNFDYENDYELLYLISENNEDATNTLFDKYAPVIDYYAKMYTPYIKGKGYDYNDLYQEGLIGLDSAINSYKNTKDIKFSTFAFTCIKRKMLLIVKNANRKKHSLLNESYSIDFHIDDEDKQGFINKIASSNSGIEDLLVDKENQDIFNEKLNTILSKSEREVYKLRVSGFSYEEIANMLSKTTKSVENSLFRIRIKIKKILEEIN